MNAEPRKANFVRLVFEWGFDERDEWEAQQRGYRSHVWAELDDASLHALTFYDIARLSQTLDDECASGRMFFTEPGLVIVPEVTRANMESAARALASEGFFSRSAPSTTDSERRP
jgi:hypothetical protein